MKIKCMHCENKYDVQANGQCPSCGGRGGYMQEPRSKQVGKLNVHLEDVLIHIESNNEYQIKEIQVSGMIAMLIKSPIVPENAKAKMRVYISNTTISEYKNK